MLFVATDKQIRLIGVYATKASHSLGNLELSPDEIPLEQTGMFLDYFQGRRVKLFIHRRGKTPGGETVWETSQLDPSYQSWLTFYGTIEELIRSVVTYNAT